METRTEVPEIELRSLCKSFGNLKANDDICLRVRRGSIHAVIGENGAGKSTAMKMLYGIHAPTSGEILIRGRPKKWRTPADAIEAGIGMVHQHFMLAGPCTALENVLLGAEHMTLRGRLPFLPEFLLPVDRERAKERLDSLCDQYGLHRLDWDAWIEDLPVGIQQRIEILKLLYRRAEILILDEPTAVLTPQETQELFVNLRKLARDGKTILIITHKLREVMNLADEVTVFRAGKVVGHRMIAETGMEDLADLMVGRKVTLRVEVPPQPKLGQPALEVKGLSLGAPRGAAHGVHRLKNLNLSVHGGEVVGIAGVEGNGQSELLQVLQHPGTHLRQLTGNISILGTEVISTRSQWALSTDRIRELGVGVIPEDRLREGLLLQRTLDENFILGLHRRSPFSKHGVLQPEAILKYAKRAAEEFDVRPRDLGALAGGLSGGNQQKVIIGREFETRPRLLIAAQPTRGVDVGAIEFIHKKILQARTEGAGVLLVSSELDEILALSDRILVMFAGEIAGEFARGQAGEQQLGLCMGGART